MAFGFADDGCCLREESKGSSSRDASGEEVEGVEECDHRHHDRVVDCPLFPRVGRC